MVLTGLNIKVKLFLAMSEVISWGCVLTFSDSEEHSHPLVLVVNGDHRTPASKMASSEMSQDVKKS